MNTTSHCVSRGLDRLQNQMIRGKIQNKVSVSCDLPFKKKNFKQHNTVMNIYENSKTIKNYGELLFDSFVLIRNGANLAHRFCSRNEISEANNFIHFFTGRIVRF